MPRTAWRPVFVALTLVTASALSHAQSFRVSSPQFRPGGTLPAEQVFNGFGCSGANRSPALEWQHAPAGTRSFAVTAYDPDAPTGSGWWHWVVYNLPASTTGLPEGAGAVDAPRLPAGAVQGRTDFGNAGYGGACPPPGAKAHRYVFTVHALKVDRLDVPADASPAMVGFFLTMNRLGSARIEARYGR